MFLVYPKVYVHIFVTFIGLFRQSVAALLTIGDHFVRALLAIGRYFIYCLFTIGEFLSNGLLAIGNFIFF